ncbi:SlyX family protein [Desulfosediminicola flagellatus]|uniref:SlyX family protein n=1 Tax=Desulfosediminicola flagellatus TaxID=2569541 RepID=UPI0010AB61B9|nr:SlyX family protein [Desulfosediminicola flagellatus]
MSSELEDRIRVLEEKHEYQDQTVETLNQVIIRQQVQLDKILAEFAKLQEFISASGVDSEVANERPPHY